MSLDEDVPKSLDDDDADMEKAETRIRKEKEMSLDDDDYAMRLGKMAQRIENQNKIWNDHLKLPSLSLRRLETYLPAMVKTFRTKDWSLLQKYCFRTDSSSTEKNLSLEEALQNELVATCFWFVLTKDACPPQVKDCFFSALRFILSLSPKASDMPIAQEEGVDHAPRKMSIDQASIDGLVVDALRLGDVEIIRQVCDIIIYIVAFNLTDTVGTGIQSQLVEVACSFPFRYHTNVAATVLAAINKIGSVFEDGVVREKLVEAVLSDTEWLLKFMRAPDDFLVEEAYDILVCITRGGQYNDDAGIWEALKFDFLPQMLKRCSIVHYKGLRIYAARVISNIINGASPEQIGELVYGLDDLLPVLLDFLHTDEIRCMSMVAIESILKAHEDESDYNIYAIKIGEHLGKESLYGWELLDNEAPNSDDILVKYAPEEWLSTMRQGLLVLREEM